jgi:hypothetical protein
LIDKYSFLEEILKSRRELAIAQQQFDEVSDPLLVDHLVFRMGAAEKQFDHLLRLARELGISFDGMQWEWKEN